MLGPPIRRVDPGGLERRLLPHVFFGVTVDSSFAVDARFSRECFIRLVVAATLRAFTRQLIGFARFPISLYLLASGTIWLLFTRFRPVWLWEGAIGLE